MKKIYFFSVSALALLLSACGTDTGGKTESGKIKLQFKPEKDKSVSIGYWFSVNNTSSGDVSIFDLQSTGKADVAENGIVTLNLTNDHIKMSGKIMGEEVNGSAEGPDSVTGNAKLVALPIFSLLHKYYRSTYTSQLDKKTEVQVNGNEIVDSTENKMQFLLRYPPNEVAPGESWNRDIMVSVGSKMTCSAKYTLKEVKGDTAYIFMDGKLSGAGDKFGNEYTMEGKINGDFEVDIKTGWPIESDTHQEFVLKMGGKEVPMIYDIKCKVK